MEGKDKVSIEVVDKLPEKPVEGKIVYNSADKYFYIGEDEKEVN